MPSRPLRNRSGAATFLCYHSVAPEGPRYLAMAPELFERQLAQLRRRGFAGGDLAALGDLAAGRASGRSAFLTFDDGFRDNHETAMPLLREYGFGAFVFVLPPLLDAGAPFEWPEMRDDLARFPTTMRSVTWSMLGEMKESGFEVGSHTLSHPHLPRLGGEELRQELWDSRLAIKQRLGSCDTLAYPFGEWSESVAAAAADCGYRFAFTLPTVSGQRDATPLSIPRVNVDYRDDERRFGLKLSRSGRRLLLSAAVGALRRRRAG
ncbi:MAG TPA: polysaccharide deacetylase family protein [Solirubrobacterales bacterium]|nr:polysaccharide deacetylase family protein [Solirubrobacterales bacterium]